MNYADSEKIHRILMTAGLRKVIDPLKADIIILNTCSVRQKGEDKVFGFMNGVTRNHLVHQSGHTVLFGITGCMVRKSWVARRYIDLEKYKRHGAEKITLLSSSESLLNYDDELFLRSESIDFTFRIEEVSFVTKILSLISGEDIGNDAKFNEYLAVKQLQENPASANIIIQTGCDNFCTFCIVPHTRGRETSRSQREIVDEIREVVWNGTKEITLLGQNVNSYGKESRAKLWNSEELTWTSKEVKTPFRELLDEINTIEGLDRIRFTSSNPHDMTKDILDAHFDLGKMCPYLHFALQSGSDTMLKRMNRKHSYADFKSQVDYLRAKDPLFRSRLTSLSDFQAKQRKSSRQPSGRCMSVSLISPSSRGITLGLVQSRLSDLQMIYQLKRRLDDGRFWMISSGIPSMLEMHLWSDEKKKYSFQEKAKMKRWWVGRETGKKYL
jgi:tRNA-2-methylthio-N6-dimethylallyladenosine synthase